MNTEFFVSDDKTLLDIDCIYGFLSNSYWARNIPLATMKIAIKNSLCFGVYDSENKQVGFARVITDQATFAYLADVFILKEYRGRGLSKELVSYILKMDALQGLRRMVLVTADAHSLYEKFEFTQLNKPSGFMEIWQPNIYQKQQATV